MVARLFHWGKDNKTKNMNKKNNYQLIDGTFAASDASKILLEIINNKIRHHNLQILSIRETSNGDTSQSERRIKTLRKTSNAIKKILAKAQKKDLQVKIQCPIEIAVLNK